MTVQRILQLLRNTFRKDVVLIGINIVGLAIALAASLLIVFYVQHETSYDRHWPGAERLYRLNNNFDLPGRAPYRLATTSSLLVPALRQAFPSEVELAARARTMSITYRIGAESFKDSVVAVDSGFDSLFPLDTVSGSIPAALADTAGIALSETLAQRLFGTVDALARTLTIEYPSSTVDYRVSAVYRMPEPSSILELPALIRFDEALEPAWQAASLDTWYQAPVASYVRLKPGVNADTVRAGLDSIADNNVDITPMVPGPGIKPSDRLFFDMSSISALHLDSDFQNVRGAGNRVTVQAFAFIAALVLLIACINFAYLMLARSDRRATEVGVRKILGASQRQLLMHYLGESAVVVGIALVLGLALVELFAPALAALLGTPLRVDYASSGTYVNILAVYLLVAVLGGLYPALAMSGVRPALVLKARPARQGDAPPGFKNMLLVFQFGVAIALIIATAVIWLQVEFVSRRDPGLRQDHLIFLNDLLGRQDVSANKEVLRERIETLPGVVSASLSSYHPLSTTTQARLSSAHRLEGRGEETFILANAFVDEAFFPTYGIAIVAGRNFSSDLDLPVLLGPEGAHRPRTALINEAAARFLGFAEPEAALGKFITDGNYEIIGVVADNQFYSLKARTRPEIYFYFPAQADVLAVSYRGDLSAVMEELQKTWRGVMGGAVFVPSFIETLLTREFAQERKEGRVFVVFALFAVIIACLGLYGASAFSVERRTREIGIRKVMGAEVREIITLLIWQFSRPVLLANGIAWPLAVWAMLTWLRKFPYQMKLVLLIPICVLAGAVALSIAWLTVAGNTLRVASAKPVMALRYE